MEYQPDMGGSYGDKEPLTTFQIWVMAITQPVEETYSRILANPNKSAGMALVWIFVVSLIGSTISMISNAIFGSYLTAPRLLDLGEYSSIFEDMAEYTSGGFSLGQVLCIPVWAVVAVIVFLIQAGVIHFIAGALGGNGSYSDLIYVNATFAAPIGLVTSVVSAIPVVGCFGIFVGLYGLYLGVVALKVVHRFDWGKAVATYGILIGIVVVFVCVIFTLMAAAITQLFEALGV